MKKIHLLGLLASVIAVLLATAGLTYAWFTQNAALATLLTVLPPDSISIIPISADGSAMTELDLDYQEGIDNKDDEGFIHIVRPIRIESTSPAHQLEIVHTTNLSNLSFNIYPAKEDGTRYPEGDIRNTPIGGGYNNQNLTTGLAYPDILVNYEKTGDVADIHAYPLYWLAKPCAIAGKTQEGWQLVESDDTQTGLDPNTKEEKQFYHTYYYLEISWKEETKETDLFYIMAQNVDVGS